MTLNIPNVFVHTEVSQRKEKIIMKIRGALVNILLEICPGVYDDYVIYEGDNKLVYVIMLKVLYGMMIASVLYYKRFIKDIKTIGFELNPYDMCVANRIVDKKQHTIIWHVNDVKSSHVDPKVNDKFKEWYQKIQGKFGDVKVTRGKIHDYLAMILDYTKSGELTVDMVYNIDKMKE